MEAAHLEPVEFDALETTDKKLSEIYRYLITPKPSSADTFGGSHAAAVPIWDAEVKRAGGIAEYVIQIKQRLSGYPESSRGIIGSWDNEPIPLAFRAAHTNLF